MNAKPGYALALLLLTSGCFDDMDWRTVPGSQDQAVRRALWRTPDELWLQGTDPTLVRESSGAWQAFSLCTGVGFRARDFVFDTDDVIWAACSKLGATTTEKLLRFERDRSFAEVAYPDGETSLTLVQAGKTARFMGKEQLYLYDGAAWQTLAPHPFRSTGGGIGEGPDDFYVDGDIVDTAPTAWHWDGEQLEKTALPDTRGMTLRGGKLYSGISRVKAGKLVAPPEAKDTLGRNIRLSSALDEQRFVHLAMPFSTAFESAETGGVWLQTDSDADLAFLGHAPFNTGSLYGGGGISLFYAIDESTVLVGVAAGASGNGGKLVEGK